MSAFGVLNRLRIWQKLFVVGLMFLVPLGVTTFFLLDEKRIKIDFARQELYGDEYLRPCARLLENAVRHRSLSRRAARGEATGTELTDVQRRIDNAIAELNSVQERLGAALSVDERSLALQGKPSSAHPRSISVSWSTLKSRPDSVAKSDALHDAFITDIASLISYVGDTSKLILDPDLDTYYMMDALLLEQPELHQWISRLVSDVDDIIARGMITPAERAKLAAAVAFVQDHANKIQVDANKSITLAPQLSNWKPLAATLNPPKDELAAAADALTGAITRDVVNSEQVVLKSEVLFELTKRLSEAAGRYWTTLFSAEDEMLRIREAGDLERRRFALLAVLIAVGASTVVTILIMRSITVPVKRATGVAEQLARGELPDKVEVGNATDETGKLLHAINNMLKFLDLRRTISTLQSSGERLAATMAQLEGDSIEQTEAAVRQASALQETHVTAQQIKQTSRMASEKASSVLEVAQRAEEIGKAGEDAIETTVGGLTDIRQQADDIAQKVNELNERTVQIGVITQTVKDLADQSNMLALNAAIEAVRSGEHGRGFAVVAREIRSLADQSIQATARVAEILETISASIRQVVSIAETGRVRMEFNISQVRSSGERLRELSSLVRDTSQSVRVIAGAVSQQDAGIAQIFTAISEQSKLMDETMKRSEAAKSAVQTARDVAGQVTNVAGRFKV
ncbi:MAG: methyl-accepting chemotaxis protein [Kofleriaceae bacterium]